ncbi:MAG: hypothetical protein J3K34DRAFT_526479 [Monoraphidium minutum]|nr:MAG: hypothetical protein J3K34DRAFT_526479 [Monoraphidium minutum]
MRPPRVESHIVLDDRRCVPMTWLASGADGGAGAARGHGVGVGGGSGGGGGGGGGALPFAVMQLRALALPSVAPLSGRHHPQQPPPAAGAAPAPRLDGWPALLAAAALGANAAVLLFLARRAWLRRAARAAREGAEEEQHEEAARVALAYLQRLWDVSVQAAAAGAPPDLGAPDADGVYTYEGRGGSRLYLRRAPRPLWERAGGGGGGGGTAAAGGAGAAAPPAWQWSTGKRVWLPAAAADSIWCDSGELRGSPCLGGRLLIRRLELEVRLARGGGAAAGGAASPEPRCALPPLELPRGCLKPHAHDFGCGGVSGCGGGGGGAGGLGADTPDSFVCPLSQRVMTDPVVTPGGVTYDRPALEAWVRRHGTDPVTGHPISLPACPPNLNLRDQIVGHFLVRCDATSDAGSPRTPEGPAAAPGGGGGGGGGGGAPAALGAAAGRGGGECGSAGGMAPRTPDW